MRAAHAQEQHGRGSTTTWCTCSRGACGRPAAPWSGAHRRYKTNAATDCSPSHRSGTSVVLAPPALLPARQRCAHLASSGWAYRSVRVVSRTSFCMLLLFLFVFFVMPHPKRIRQCQWLCGVASASSLFRRKVTFDLHHPTPPVNSCGHHWSGKGLSTRDGRHTVVLPRLCASCPYMFSGKKTLKNGHVVMSSVYHSKQVCLSLPP